MSIKLFKDTLQLKEFSNQRFLYGNFLPALFGTFVIFSLVLWIVPLTTDNLPLVGIIILIALAIALLTHRASRFVIYYGCLVKRLYQHDLTEDSFLEDLLVKFSPRLEKGGDEIKISEIKEEEVKDILVEDLRKCFYENFFNHPDSPEAEELRRHESLFLLGFWGSIWTVGCYFAFKLFSRVDEIQIWLFQTKTSLNEPFIAIISSIFFIGCISITLVEWTGIRKNIVKALPLNIKPLDPVVKARHEAVEEIIETNNENIEKNLVLAQIKPEFRSYMRFRLREATGLIRIRKLLVKEEILTKRQAEDFIETIEDLKEFGQYIDRSEAKLLRSIQNKAGIISNINPTLDDEGKIISLDLAALLKGRIPTELYQLTQLQTLSLIDNQLTTLPPEISQLTQLQRLSLDYNQLTALPPELYQLTQLQTLSLTENQLTTLPPEIGQLTQLQRLSLVENQLTTLPPELYQLTQLQELSLDGNELTTLPPEIGQLTQLQELSLDGNELTTLPPELYQLTQLQTLSLIGNQLTILPPEIGQLTQLQDLYLDYNQLTTLPPEIGQLTQLQDLYLAGNQLTTLPPEFGQITSLSYLDLRMNPKIGSDAKLWQYQALKLFLRGFIRNSD